MPNRLKKMIVLCSEKHQNINNCQNEKTTGQKTTSEKKTGQGAGQGAALLGIVDGYGPTAPDLAPLLSTSIYESVREKVVLAAGKGLSTK